MYDWCTTASTNVSSAANSVTYTMGDNHCSTQCWPKSGP